MASGGEIAGYLALFLVIIAIILIIILMVIAFTNQDSIINRIEGFIGWNVIAQNNNSPFQMMTTNRSLFVYSGSGGVTVTVPADQSTVIGTEIAFLNRGSGNITISSGAGVTISPSNITVGPNNAVSLVRVSNNNWDRLFTGS